MTSDTPASLKIVNEGCAANDTLPIAQARRYGAAFVQLYRKYYDGVFRYCVHRLFDRQTAEDITSEVFLKAAQSFADFKGQGETHFRNWLYRIATNAANDYLRKTARHNGLLKRLCEPTTEKMVDCDESAGENIAVLKRAMLALNPKYQTVITLHFFENMKLTEIAGVLGCSPGTARSQLARALAKLRKKLIAAGIYT